LAHERLSPRHFPSAIGLARIYDPAGAVAAGYLDRVVPADRVEAEAVEEAATLAATLRSGAFRMTRRIMRDDLAEALRRGIARDLEDFTVEA
jgi:enoyl-CoA hydratase